MTTKQNSYFELPGLQQLPHAFKELPDQLAHPYAPTAAWNRCCAQGALP
ncbi:MAG: hypothetical protein R3E79_02480 [Caldilineaceae bacterium]